MPGARKVTIHKSEQRYFWQGWDRREKELEQEARSKRIMDGTAFDGIFKGCGIGCLGLIAFIVILAAMMSGSR